MFKIFPRFAECTCSWRKTAITLWINLDAFLLKILFRIPAIWSETCSIVISYFWMCSISPGFSHIFSGWWIITFLGKEDRSAGRAVRAGWQQISRRIKVLEANIINTASSRHSQYPGPLISIQSQYFFFQILQNKIEKKNTFDSIQTYNVAFNSAVATQDISVLLNFIGNSRLGFCCGELWYNSILQ